MPAPLPQISLTITPPGGEEPFNAAPFFAWAGASNRSTISSNFGRQGDTATLVLVDDYSADVPGFSVAPGTPHFAVPPYSSILLVDEDPEVVAQPAGGVIFSGLVTNPQFRWISPGRVEWTLQCVDYTAYADGSIVQGIYSGIPADDIIVDVTAKADCGISALPVSQGGHVYPGPLIPLANLTYGKLSSHWTTLATLASQSAIYGWYVDQTRSLWFYNQDEPFTSGITVTDQPAQIGDTSVSECHIDRSQIWSYEWDGTTFYTRCVVEGALITVSYEHAKAVKGTIPPTDSWVGNGLQSSWPLSYQPVISALTLKAAAGIVSTIGSTAISGAPLLYVGKTLQTVAINDGTTQITAPFQFVQAANGLWTLQVTPGIGQIPGDGVPIRLWYRYQNPVIAQADLFAQQAAIGGPNGGVFAEFVKDQSLTSVPAAFQRATAQLQEYGAPQERITFYTSAEWVGWLHVGQTFALEASMIPDSQRSFQLGLSGNFFVIQQMVGFKPGGYRSTQITAVRVA